ncbi:MAG: hypothetical protein HGA71_06735 [Azonexaceae bacterium]|jgi:hypothetical protein|nr:hypothetical protein [Azonexaceae bacterium]
MRRWIAIFFLVLFPLQAVWAAAAPYCEHEKTPATFHIGHHTHEHHGAGDSSDNTDNQLPGMGDNDCQACHAFCGALYSDIQRREPLTLATVSVTTPNFALPTPPQTQPERPNWHAFA